MQRIVQRNHDPANRRSAAAVAQILAISLGIKNGKDLDLVYADVPHIGPAAKRAMLQACGKDSISPLVLLHQAANVRIWASQHR